MFLEDQNQHIRMISEGSCETDKDDKDEEDEHVCTFDPLCGILLELFSGLMGADCRDDVHASVYLTDEFAMDTHTQAFT